jgi:hypothetical protein
MPPWPAVAGYGRFANDNGLTPREMQFLVSWVEGLGPRNAGTVFLNVSDPKSRLRQEVRAAAHVAHWQLGEPDLVRALPANLVRGLVPNLAPNLTPQQRDFVQRAVIDLDLSSARRLRALEYRPGDRRVVRAATFRLEKTGQWLGSWTPWYGFTRLPKDVAHLLPPGSRLIAEIHYRASSEPVIDRGSIGLFFADGQARTPAPDLMMETTRARGGNALHAMTQLRTDTVVWALNPEIVAGLTSLEVSALRPDGGTDVLLFARDPRAEWPTPYILSEPILLRRGTQLSVVARTADRAPRPDRIRVRVARY